MRLDYQILLKSPPPNLTGRISPCIRLCSPIAIIQSQSYPLHASSSFQCFKELAAPGSIDPFGSSPVMRCLLLTGQAICCHRRRTQRTAKRCCWQFFTTLCMRHIFTSEIQLLKVPAKCLKIANAGKRCKFQVNCPVPWDKSQGIATWASWVFIIGFLANIAVFVMNLKFLFWSCWFFAIFCRSSEELAKSSVGNEFIGFKYVHENKKWTGSNATEMNKPTASKSAL